MSTLLAPGDRLREWWDGLSRVQKWGFGILLFGALALLPLYTLKVPQGIIYSGGFLLGIKAFSAAVLGGIGNLRGALLGGLLLGIMENYGQAVFGTQWRDVIAFVLLVLVLLFRPTGILGESLGKARA